MKPTHSPLLLHLIFLLLLLLLHPTTSTPLSPTTPSSNLTLPSNTNNNNCWLTPGPPLIFAACLHLIRHRLGRSHDPDVPMTFSRRAGTQILIPYLAPSPHCNVVLGIRDDKLTTVTETWRNIRDEAVKVALACVIPEPHLGGWGWVGGGELLVSVLGDDDSGRGDNVRGGDGRVGDGMRWVGVA